MDSLTLSRHFLSMMKADDLCFSPCTSVATKMSASLSAMTFERLSFPGSPFRTNTQHLKPRTSTASWPDACTPPPLSPNAHCQPLLRSDDASFCQNEGNLSFPRLQYSDGGNGDSGSHVTDTSTRYDGSSSGEADESGTYTEDEDESSFSELSYDGIEFDYGYATYKASRRAGASRTASVVVSVPDHIWREMENRISADVRQEHGHASKLRQRKKAAQSQSSQLFARVLPWPGGKVDTLQDSRHELTDSRSAAPTMPRRRDSVSTASTIDDDDNETRPLSFSPLNEQTNSGQTSTTPRIPLELQRVFLQSQAGLDVEVPPSNLPAFQEYRCRETRA